MLTDQRRWQVSGFQKGNHLHETLGCVSLRIVVSQYRPLPVEAFFAAGFMKTGKLLQGQFLEGLVPLQLCDPLWHFTGQRCTLPIETPHEP